jgi:hypothetical protein
MDEHIEREIDEYEARVYPDGGMSGSQRALLRKQLQDEDRFWAKEAVRIDSHNSHDDY